LLKKPVNKILIIRLSSLGDILLTTPIIRALSQHFNKAKIDFIIREEYTDTLRYNNKISNLLLYTNDNVVHLKDEVKESEYDLIIDLQNNFRSRNITAKTSGKIYRFKKPTWKKLLLVWFKINLLKNGKSIIKRYAETAKVHLENEVLELNVPKEFKPVLGAGKNIIGFCPGSNHFTKRWLPEYFIELGNMLTGKGFTIVLLGGKADKDICKAISEKIPGSINLQNDDDLLQTAAEMRTCKIVVTNDSGLMHTATAVKIPVVAIFGSTVREFGFAPSGIKNLILENKSLSCRPCSHIGKSACPKKHFLCMKEVKPGYVLDNLKLFIE
jgi:lipopolysaccharide heptosyltransferase II